MNNKSIYTESNIFTAMLNYCQGNNHENFTLIDVVVMDTVISNTYTNDTDLAHSSLCSLSTIKRSINKLCNFGLITKHLAHDNTKTLGVHQDNLNSFLKQYGKEVL